MMPSLARAMARVPARPRETRNGDADKQKQEKATEEDERHEHQLLPFRMRMITPMARPVMTSDRIGNQTV